MHCVVSPAWLYLLNIEMLCFFSLLFKFVFKRKKSERCDFSFHLVLSGAMSLKVIFIAVFLHFNLEANEKLVPWTATLIAYWNHLGEFKKNTLISVFQPQGLIVLF